MGSSLKKASSLPCFTSIYNSMALSLSGRVKTHESQTPNRQNKGDRPGTIALKMELSGFEPLTPSMPLRCSTN
jgi:hypothetical protein